MLSFLPLRIGKDSDPHTDIQLKSVTSALGLNFGNLVPWSLPKDGHMASGFTVAQRLQLANSHLRMNSLSL